MSNNGDISNKTTVVTVRMTPGMLRFMDEDITNNQIYRSRSDWIQTALDHFMKERLDDMERLSKIKGGGGMRFNAMANARALAIAG